MILTLEEAKAHCRVDEDYTGDDSYIEGLIPVAETDIANRIKYDSLDEAFRTATFPHP